MIHVRIVLCLLASAAFPVLAVDVEKSATATPITATAGADIASAYIFRGVTVNKNAALQPLLKVQGAGLTVGAWGNFAMDAEEGEVENEVDGFASYDIPMDLATFSVGYTEYVYPDSDLDNDQEIMAKISLATMLNPSLAAYHGVGGGILDSNYYEFGLKQEVFAQSGVTGTLGGILAYLDRETGEDGFSHLTLGAGVSYRMIAASVNYVAETDDDINDLDEQEQLYVMTGASFTF